MINPPIWLPHHYAHQHTSDRFYIVRRDYQHWSVVIVDSSNWLLVQWTVTAVFLYRRKGSSKLFWKGRGNTGWLPNPLSAEIFLYKPWRSKGCFQYQIILNVLVRSFRFIWIRMLWVYGHLLYILYFFVSGINIRHQNLTSIDVRFWRLKSILH